MGTAVRGAYLMMRNIISSYLKGFTGRKVEIKDLFDSPDQNPKKKYDEYGECNLEYWRS